MEDRRRCDMCGTELPVRPKGKRGAPQKFCTKDTGRPCALLSKRLNECEGLIYRLVEVVPSVNRQRAQYRLRQYIGTLNEARHDPHRRR